MALFCSLAQPRCSVFVSCNIWVWHISRGNTNTVYGRGVQLKHMMGQNVKLGQWNFLYGPKQVLLQAKYYTSKTKPDTIKKLNFAHIEH